MLFRSEHSIHDVDLLHWILGGTPRAVTGGTASRFGHPGIEDSATVTMEYGEHRATIVSVWHQVTSRPSTRRLEVLCEDAFCWTEDDHLGPLHVQTSAGTETILGELPDWAAALDLPDELRAPVAAYAAPSLGFLRALAAGDDEGGFPDVEVALAAHRVVDAAYRSAAAGGTPVDPRAEPSGS